jgi:hypothetical protein
MDPRLGRFAGRSGGEFRKSRGSTASGRMAKQRSEDELRQQATQALNERLRPVDALRFLALVSREPFCSATVIRSLLA